MNKLDPKSLQLFLETEREGEGIRIQWEGELEKLDRFTMAKMVYLTADGQEFNLTDCLEVERFLDDIYFNAKFLCERTSQLKGQESAILREDPGQAYNLRLLKVISREEWDAKYQPSCIYDAPGCDFVPKGGAALWMVFNGVDYDVSISPYFCPSDFVKELGGDRELADQKVKDWLEKEYKPFVRAKLSEQRLEEWVITLAEVEEWMHSHDHEYWPDLFPAPSPKPSS